MAETQPNPESSLEDRLKTLNLRALDFVPIYIRDKDDFAQEVLMRWWRWWLFAGKPDLAELEIEGSAMDVKQRQIFEQVLAKSRRDHKKHSYKRLPENIPDDAAHRVEKRVRQTIDFLVALNHLNYQQRMIIDYRREGLSLTKIAEILELDIRRVSEMHMRAIETLRKICQ